MNRRPGGLLDRENLPVQGNAKQARPPVQFGVPFHLLHDLLVFLPGGYLGHLHGGVEGRLGEGLGRRLGDIWGGCMHLANSSGVSLRAWESYKALIRR
jgi:hypothetical protein